MPSRQTRVISAPNTAITAPPARMPRTCVRPVGREPACLAAFRRLSLRGDTGAPSLAQIRLGELLPEDHPEPHQRAELRAEARAGRPERRELLGEVAHADAQHAGGQLGGAVVARLLDVAGRGREVGWVYAREQRRRVLPHVEAGVALDQLE